MEIKHRDSKIGTKQAEPMIKQNEINTNQARQQQKVGHT